MNLDSHSHFTAINDMFMGLNKRISTLNTGHSSTGPDFDFQYPQDNLQLSLPPAQGIRHCLLVTIDTWHTLGIRTFKTYAPKLNFILL